MYNDYLYPFTAIVGQEEIKEAIKICLVNPNVKGLIISGEKGTGKSTIVRSLNSLLKNKKVIDLPLNTSEDMLIGSIDIKKTLNTGEKTRSKSILNRANGNILYVDEINLLNDNLVNNLLDISNSSKVNVQREGISESYISKFILIGSMNPEEGDLNPNFLDRFGLYVDVKSSNDIYEREEIISRRLEFEDNKELFIDNYKEKEEKLLEQIKNAKNIVKEIKIDKKIYEICSDMALKAYVEGHRADIFLLETAKAIAALDNRKYISLNDIKKASKYVLIHRTRSLEDNKENSQLEEDTENSNYNDESDEEGRDEESRNQDLNNDSNNSDYERDLDNYEEPEVDTEKEDIESDNNEDRDNTENDNLESKEIEDDTYVIGETYKVKNIDIDSLDKLKRKGSGRRSLIFTDKKQGRYIKYKLNESDTIDIAFDATLRAAAIHQINREKTDCFINIKQEDLRYKVRQKRTGTNILFLVDASGSMGANKRMEAVKGAILSLLNDAYQKRDKVGMIAFRKDKSEILLDITRSVDLAHKQLKDMPTGGKTPLAAGLNSAYELLKANMKKDPESINILVLISDGRSNVSNFSDDPHQEALNVCEKIKRDNIKSIVIDTEDDFLKLELAKEICKSLNGIYYKLEDIRSDEIVSYLKENI